MILFNQITQTVTTSTGTVSGSFTSNGICHQIIVKPTTSSTQYDFKITNSLNMDIYSVDSEVGKWNDLLTLPMVGIYTYTIDNATADEDFTVVLEVRNS